MPVPAVPAPPADLGRHRAPEEVWAAVRRDYLAGYSAPACCRRHGVGRSALRARAMQEGWRRADQAWVAPGDTRDPEDEGALLEEKVGGNLDRVELRELTFVAHRRMMRAVMRGDAAEALRWHRVQLVMDREDEALQREMEREEEVWRMQYGADASNASDAVDSSDAADGSDTSDS